jgi:DtxR family Mn-dependent transcriptional regulator
MPKLDDNIRPEPPPPALTNRQADYLDAIFHLVREKHVARVKEIAGYLNVNRSTVSSVLPRLAELSLINYSPHEFISLTTEGKRIAEEHARRQRGLCDFFVNVLRVNREVARTAARSMERTTPLVIVDRMIQVGQASNLSDPSGTTWCEVLKAFQKPTNQEQGE